MIYSSTIFFNEYDLLDLKIAEELPYIDKIYITESPLTFTGNQKTLNFPIEKYKDNDKIVYLVTPKEIYKDCKIAWDREFLQRNYLQTVVPFNNDDIWFVTDMDEIICGDQVPRLIEGVKQHQIVSIHMTSCIYYINVEVVGQVWEPPFAASGRMCRDHSFQVMRNKKVRIPSVANHCGKHFSYLGGSDAIEFKLKSFSHIECGTPESIQWHLNNFNMVGTGYNSTYGVVKIDESYPQTIRNNINKWGKHIYRRQV